MVHGGVPSVLEEERMPMTLLYLVGEKSEQR